MSHMPAWLHAKAFTGLLLLSGVPQVLCFRTLRRQWSECSLTRALTHTEGSSLLASQTSKLAVPWGTSNAGEAIKRQKLFSVRSWFIWLKNETTNPTDIIFPSQGLLYQAEPKLLPGGNPLKSRKAQPGEPKLSCLLLSSSLWLRISFCRCLHFSLGCHSFINN